MTNENNNKWSRRLCLSLIGWDIIVSRIFFLALLSNIIACMHNAAVIIYIPACLVYKLTLNFRVSLSSKSESISNKLSDIDLGRNPTNLCLNKIRTGNDNISKNITIAKKSGPMLPNIKIKSNTNNTRTAAAM